jgi:hypothetical protein
MVQTAARIVGQYLLVSMVTFFCSSAVAGSTPERSAAELEAIFLETIGDRLRPIIQVELDGQGPFQLYVDTGAGGNLISAELAGRLGLEATGRQRVFNPSGGGVQEVDLVEVSLLESGALRLEGLPFVAADLPQLGDIQGVLSVSSLPPGLVSFDFAANRIRIEPGTLAEDDPEVIPYQPLPIAMLSGVVEGRNLTFHLDTGSPDGITLPGALARELSFDGELVTTRERGPLVVQAGRLLGTIRIGHLELDNPEVNVVDLFPDFGNIGCAFLQHWVLTMDRERGLLRLSSPPDDGD